MPQKYFLDFFLMSISVWYYFGCNFLFKYFMFKKNSVNILQAKIKIIWFFCFFDFFAFLFFGLFLVFYHSISSVFFYFFYFLFFNRICEPNKILEFSISIFFCCVVCAFQFLFMYFMWFCVFNIVVEILL